MLKNISKIIFAFIFLASSTVLAQEPDYSQLDPKPYDPKTEPDIDMYMGSWKDSPPKHTHGYLVERDILTQCDGDPMKPPTKGAVLKYVNRFTYATLEMLTSTEPTTLVGEQELFHVLSGKGTVTGGKKTYNIYPGITFLIPEKMKFTIENTGKERLTMYLVAEPTREGFRPNEYIVVNDEATTPIATSTSHWVNIFKHLIKPEEEGLADLQLVLNVWLSPNTFAQPHSHIEGCEEVWCTIEGDVKFLLGKQIRNLPPGTAYLIPPNGITPHANFNVSDDMIKIFYFARFADHEPRK